MEQDDIKHAIEAVLFASATPMRKNDLRNIFLRYFESDPSLDQGMVMARMEAFDQAFDELLHQAKEPNEQLGFALVQVAEGLTFRSSSRYKDILLAMRDERPARLSQAALETLAIIAYRQPTTKPEIDEIRGVDSGGTLRLLLDRSLVRIVGKKEEPGRPMLYGTTRDFLSFFNLNNLTQLPTLREFHELSQESQEELDKLEESIPPLQALSAQAKKMHLEEDPGLAALDEAVTKLGETESSTRVALASQGIVLEEVGSLQLSSALGATDNTACSTEMMEHAKET